MLRLKDQLASLTARNESLNVQMEGLRRQAAAMQSKAECSEAECMTLNKWLQQKEDALKVQQNTQTLKPKPSRYNNTPPAIILMTVPSFLFCCKIPRSHRLTNYCMVVDSSLVPQRSIGPRIHIHSINRL
jgi:hypothetical protein